MDNLNITTVIAALNKFNAESFNGDRFLFGEALLKAAKENMDDIRTLCNIQEIKFGNDALWNGLNNACATNKTSIKVLLTDLYKRPYDVDLSEIHKSINKALNTEVPDVYFDNFVNKCLKPKAETYVTSLLAKKSAAKEAVEHAKWFLKQTEQDMDRFLEDASDI